MDFSELNERQHQALVSPEDRPLEILAGPGTGKTKVLTSRVAYLLSEVGLDPKRVIVTTFTRKAAEEMRTRLDKMLMSAGSLISASSLMMGTFHSICVRLLRAHGRSIGLSNFSIIDQEDANKIMYKEMAANKVFVGKSERDCKKLKAIIKSVIGKYKAEGYLPDDVPIDPNDKHQETNLAVFRDYQGQLKARNVIDFDDCLIFANRLLDAYPQVVNNIQHVLVDEFQDTNSIQLKLIYQFALASGDHLTVVGDPDQSIYGFRNASSNNFYKLEDHYRACDKSVDIIQLKDNYRSTREILDLAETVISSRVKKRVAKQLVSHHKDSSKVVYDEWEDPNAEAAGHVKDMLRLHKEGYSYNDMAVLVRAGYFSRVYESELIAAHIPYEILHGRSFWDLVEVKLVISILSCTISDTVMLSWAYVLEKLVDGVGDRTIQGIDSAVLARPDNNVTETLKQVCQGELVRCNENSRNHLRKLLDLVLEERKSLRSNDNQPNKLSCMFDRIVSELDLEEKVLQMKSGTKSLKELKQGIHDNLKELCEQMVTFKPEEPFEGSDSSSDRTSPNAILTAFLDSIYLYEQARKEMKHDHSGSVKVSTIHGAKGLEWPIVFVPRITTGAFPSFNATDMDEEARCLYVALTRAKDHLYISHVQKMFGEQAERSPLLSGCLYDVNKRNFKAPRKEQHSRYDYDYDDYDVYEGYERICVPHKRSYGGNNRRKDSYSHGKQSKKRKRQEVPPNAGFQTARSVLLSSENKPIKKEKN